MALDEDLSLAVLQGDGPSQVGLYPPSVLGRWRPLHTLGEAALRHSRVGYTLSRIVQRMIFGPWTANALLYSQPLCSGLTRWRSCRGEPLGLGRWWPRKFGGRCLPRRKTEKVEGGSRRWGMHICWGWLVGPISPPRLRRKKERIEGDLIGVVGAPFSRPLQKGNQNHRERREDHLYITKKVMGQWLRHGAAFELGRREWFALRRLITNSRSSAFTGSFLKLFS